MASEKELFFHVGLGKTGSTYLQDRFFPILKGIYYLPTREYRHCKRILPELPHNRVLLSREFDTQLPDEVKWFSVDYPDAHVIIVLRRQDSWIASQYRRFVKNGFRGSFSAFMDVEGDKGFWKRKELNFMDKLECIRAHFTKEPLILIYEDFKKDPEGFLKQIAAYCGATYEGSELNRSVKHASYNEKQLKVIRKCGMGLLNPVRKPIRNPVLRFARRMWFSLVRYSILYGALLVPSFLVSKKPLIAPEELEKVRAFTEADWNACLQAAEASREALAARIH